MCLRVCAGLRRVLLEAATCVGSLAWCGKFSQAANERPVHTHFPIRQDSLASALAEKAQLEAAAQRAQHNIDVLRQVGQLLRTMHTD